MRFGAEESQKILSILIDAKRVTANQARAALKTFDGTVAELKSRLAALEHGASAPSHRRRRKATRRAKPSTRRIAARRPRKISAKRKKAMRDQGRYLAAVRPLAKALRAQVKRIREKSGVDAAIRTAEGLGRKRDKKKYGSPRRQVRHPRRGSARKKAMRAPKRRRAQRTRSQGAASPAASEARTQEAAS